MISGHDGKVALGGIFDSLGRFAAANGGNFGLIFGLSAVPLILGIGGAVDYSNALREKSSVQAAADSAALTAAKYSGNDEKARIERADMYFKANLDPDIEVQSTALKKVDGSWVYDATFSMPTAFLGLISIDKLDMAVQSVVKQSDTPLDIALVLDSTGSMEYYGKMTQLKAAVNLFLDNFDDVSEEAKVQVAMIPFDYQIRIDDANMTMLEPPKADCRFLSEPDKGYCNSGDDGFVLGTGETYYAGRDRSSHRYIKYYYTASDTPDQVLKITRYTYSCKKRTYSDCTISDASLVYSRDETLTKVYGNYSGCIMDRLQPYDTTPDVAVSSDAETLYTRSAACSSSLQPVVGLTDDFDGLRTAVAKLTPSGTTNIAIGVQWGMEALTSANPLQGANSDTRTKKIMVVLTDGDNTQDRWYNSSDSASIDDRTELACSSAKAMTNTDGSDLELYTIRVIEGNETLLQNCATDAGHYYSVKQASELSAVFQDIAERVKRLRIVS
ncbi:TadE/TadG family type IV pilus assembly protein [Jiella mangrovi]|uniref:VWA domain-containing protein n=1 Tax=Jiella mangrovi TaxID=2821407 RepID=A0ABS4BI12_9HYPH|nr:pilus assembly protein [Jiella mangrovi]MBP0616397.1 VWA domain-containing protein [Jiella mangrovi]